MKRRPAILFIFLAITVILAHSFIPHIHHEDHMCVVSSPCPLTGEADQAPDDGPRSPRSHSSPCSPGHSDAGHKPCYNCRDTEKQQHGHHGKSTNCELSDILVYTPQSHKSNSTINFDDNKIDHKTYNHAVPLTPATSISAQLTNQLFRQKPFQDAAFRKDEEHYVGSRAPPLS